MDTATSTVTNAAEASPSEASSATREPVAAGSAPPESDNRSGEATMVQGPDGDAQSLAGRSAAGSAARRRPSFDPSLVFLWIVGCAAVLGLGFYGYTSVAAWLSPRAGASRGIVLINVTEIEAPYFDLMKHKAGINGRALGSAIGRAISSDARRYAAAGFTVVNGYAVLAVPRGRNVTTEVSADVARQLGRENPEWVLAPPAMSNPDAGKGGA